ncbi:hypothetical protein ACPPVW_18610 [Leifsonia sp. McL0607]|uniref:hypothetical protein n=1 Tax=Leifsonia sp. McL0607 TaxID=3415672 RepID=UPI003CF7B4AE
MTDHLVPVMSPDIPLNPTNELDVVRQQKMVRDHDADVASLTEKGYHVVPEANAAINYPDRRPATYTLVTWLEPPQ